MLVFILDPSINGEQGFKGLRYNEFIAPMVQTIQYLYERVQYLEDNL